MNNIQNKNEKKSNKALMELSYIKYYGNHNHIYLKSLMLKYPILIKNRKNLINIKIENNILCEVHFENIRYFGDNLPNIKNTISASSYFAIREASQNNIKYLNPQIPIDNFANNFITAKNQ